MWNWPGYEIHAQHRADVVDRRIGHDPGISGLDAPEYPVECIRPQGMQHQLGRRQSWAVGDQPTLASISDFFRQFERTDLTAVPKILDQRLIGQNRFNEVLGAVYELRSNVDVDIGPGFRLWGLGLDDDAISEDHQGQQLVSLGRSAHGLSSDNLAEPVTHMSRLPCPATRNIGGARNSPPGYGLVLIAGHLIDLFDQQLKVKFSVAAPLTERHGVHRQ